MIWQFFQLKDWAQRYCRSVYGLPFTVLDSFLDFNITNTQTVIEAIFSCNHRSLQSLSDYVAPHLFSTWGCGYVLLVATVSNCTLDTSRGTAQISELGPRSNKKGPNLLLIQGVQQSPAWFLEWFKSSILPSVVQRYFWLDPRTPLFATKVTVIFQNALQKSLSHFHTGRAAALTPTCVS